MNIMMTCAGRRNYLVHYFSDALGGRGRVFVTDASDSAPSIADADEFFIAPPVSHAEYVDVIFRLCLRSEVRLLLSLNDLELPILAANRDRFLLSGTIPVVSSPDVIDICSDKSATAAFLREARIDGPRTYETLDRAFEALDEGHLEFPLVVKPRWGTASIGIEFANDRQELELAHRWVQGRITSSFLADVGGGFGHAVLIQEKLSGQEYGLDVVNDLNGRYVATFARRKLSMRGGETDRAITVVDPRLEALGEAIGRRLGHIGNLDCDVFDVGGTFHVLEMNPRFGGGYPFSHAAGANLPAALIAWAQGDQADPSWLQIAPNVMASKCDRIVTLRT